MKVMQYEEVKKSAGGAINCSDYHRTIPVFQTDYRVLVFNPDIGLMPIKPGEQLIITEGGPVVLS
ncbi:MAG: hypothetical protein K0S20_359 [Patescibacteria group bacterium]|jgi:hypothetical protein|nr:hypothetical protein [Patescibacteria group bacterium]